MHVIGTPLSHIKSKLDKKSENIYQIATYNNTVEIYFLFNIFLKQQKQAIAIKDRSTFFFHDFFQAIFRSLMNYSSDCRKENVINNSYL